MEGVWISAGHKGEVIANQSGPGKALLWHNGRQKRGLERIGDDFSNPGTVRVRGHI